MENTIENCRKRMLNFIQDWGSAEGLNIIINIYDEIKFYGRSEEDIRQKYLRILYNIKGSSNWHSILDDEDWAGLELFLNDFLKIQYDGEKYYIGCEYFNELSLDEIYQILLEAKYLKEKEIDSTGYTYTS